MGRLQQAARASAAVKARPTQAAGNPATGADRALRPLTRGVGRGLVIGMPYFLRALGVVGTAAMPWVGGIILHGLEEFGAAGPGRLVHGAAEWLATAACSGLLGLALGGMLIPLVRHAGTPASRTLKTMVGQGKAAGSQP